ncbi:MAG: hypothetical protein FWG39_01550 [Alphaproteobacteria bacterium]|nr:hypothetical protein [Alphaproteobacteria bacterium]
MKTKNIFITGAMLAVFAISGAYAQEEMIEVCDEAITGQPVCVLMTPAQMEAQRLQRIEDEKKAGVKTGSATDEGKKEKMELLKVKQSEHDAIIKEIARLDEQRVKTNEKLNEAKENHSYFAKIASSNDGKTGMVGFRKTYTAAEQKEAQEQSSQWFAEREKLQAEIDGFDTQIKAEQKKMNALNTEIENLKKEIEKK